MKNIIAYCILLFFFSGCTKQNKVIRSFYYWKTTFDLTKQEQELISDLEISKIYLHYFDLQWIDSKQECFPVGKMIMKTTLPSKLNIVPVVYIVNDVFLKVSISEIPNLAQKTFSLIHSMNQSNTIQVNEIQFDCDWTDSSRDNYFLFLKEIRKYAGTNFSISATIRLHQVKYKRRTGIPPVDKGMLMFYNMGKINVNGRQNSIYEYDIAKGYVNYINSYTLPLDYVFPIYSWGILSHNGQLTQLINAITSKDLIATNKFQLKESNLFEATDNFFFKGSYIFKGDIIKIEELTPELTATACKQILPEINSSKFTVAFYHLDPILFQNYDQQKLNNLFSIFN